MRLILTSVLFFVLAVFSSLQAQDDEQQNEPFHGFDPPCPGCGRLKEEGHQVVGERRVA